MRTGLWWVAVVVTAGSGAAGSPALAQQIAPTALAAGRGVAAQADTTRVPWYAPLASLAVPGMGQAILHQNRGFAYFAAELYSFIGYRAQTVEADRGRDLYRSLARDVARAFFGSNRPDGPWSYYEAMEHFDASGAFDRNAGGAFAPEIDETTYNGSIWKLARDTYWPDPNVTPPTNSPAYINAINMYIQRAAGPNYLWSWQNAALEHDLYQRTISLTNDSYRRAREQLGILIANHLLSMADAFATVRVRYPSSAGLAVDVSLPWPIPR